MSSTNPYAMNDSRLVELLARTQSLVFVKDGEGRYLYANRRFCEFLGVQQTDIIGCRDRDFVTNVEMLETIEESDRQTLALGERVSVQRHSALKVDGTPHTFLVTKVPLFAPDKTVMAVCAILSEITDEAHSTGTYGRPPFYDLLTDLLPSRSVFMRRVEQALIATREKHAYGALLLLDFDKFQLINDARGYECGDQILQEAARRLAARTFANNTVCRIGGDEFAVLLPYVGDSRQAATINVQRIAQQLMLVLTQAPFDVVGIRSSLTVSIGIVLLAGESQDPEHTLHDAELATHRAKALGGNRVVFYEQTMQRDVQQHLDLEQGLSAALSENALQMFVQPQGTVDGVVSGAELLARWWHPEHGPIPPDIFIPLAERTGMIHQITDWSLGVACELANRLRNHGRQIPISVNISPVCLMARDFVHRTQMILERSSAAGSGLIFEITEGIWLRDAQVTKHRIKSLAHLGIRFSIDDFGSGYSNLSYLKNLSLYEIKIDKSLVQDLPQDADSCTIMELTLAMAQRLGLRTTAEGVETEAQAQFLTRCGCDALQGYLLARPMPIDTWLAKTLA